MDDRKIFNHLHEELSLAVGEYFPRMSLWEEVWEFTSEPLTKETALRFLNERAPKLFPDIPEKKLRRLTKRFERWDPNADTPEEIFARICGGLKGEPND